MCLFPYRASNSASLLGTKDFGKDFGVVVAVKLSDDCVCDMIGSWLVARTQKMRKLYTVISQSNVAQTILLQRHPEHVFPILRFVAIIRCNGWQTPAQL